MLCLYIGPLWDNTDTSFLKTTTSSMVWAGVQGIIHLNCNITWFLEHINQLSSKSVGLRETVSKNRHQFNHLTIIFLIIDYRNIRIILFLQLLIDIPINIKYWQYINIICIGGTHCPTNIIVVLGSLNCHKLPTNFNQRYVSTRYGWFRSDTCWCIICDGRYFLIAGSWKWFNAFLVRIGKGGKVGDACIGNTNHSCIWS